MNLSWVRNFWFSFWCELAKSFNSLAELVLSCISRSWLSRSLSLSLSSISLYSRMAYIFSFLISRVSFSALLSFSSKSCFAFSLTLHVAHYLFVDCFVDMVLRFWASSKSLCLSLRTFSVSSYFFFKSAKSWSNLTFSCLKTVRSRSLSLALAFFLINESRSALISTSNWLLFSLYFSSDWVMRDSFSPANWLTYLSRRSVAWVSFSISRDFSWRAYSYSSSWALIPSFLLALRTWFSLSRRWILCSMSPTIY